MSEAQRPLLIVEDDPALQKQMRWSFDRYETLAAGDRESALALVRRQQPPVVTMDLGLPPDPDSTSEGFALLEQILAVAPDTKVIVLTGQNDRTNALRAIDMGAYDFFAKPFEPELLTLTIDRAFRLHDLQQENKRLQAMRQPDAMSGIISRDPEMLRVCRVIEKVANTNATEPAIARKSGAEGLLESELFGHEKGAFTGATGLKRGKFELADKGTLFLDEIGDLPLALQAKLLRFLQERVFERVGGRQEIAIDVRIVCATHQDLKELIKAGRFREDLYYRLAEIVTVIPPLRARIGDAVLLANAFARRFAEQHSRGAMVLTADALRAIEVHGWPGNVRELENCIKRAVIMADNTQITADDVGLAAADDNPMAFDLRTIREAAEKTAVLAVMARVNGNIAKAAEMLGVSRPTLYDLMHRFGLK